jgi:hypothetical protein
VGCEDVSSSRGGTDRPFTVVVCTACAASDVVSVIEELRPTIRRCPRAMLVSATCMLGPLTCASRPSGRGVMALVQPCTDDRTPCGPPHWIGPITDDGEAAALRDWLERGQWETSPVPRHLDRHQFWARDAGRSN